MKNIIAEMAVTRLKASKRIATATIDYNRKLLEAKGLLADIERALDRHALRQQEQLTNRGFVGDLVYVNNELADVLGFLRPL